jgi:hypothetical protein
MDAIEFKVYSALDENRKQISHPENIKIELMEHQRTGIYAMVELEKSKTILINNFIHYTNKPTNYELKTNVGILGDKVGSGKSLMIVSLINSDNEINYDQYYLESTKFMTIKEISNNENKSNCNIIIVPDNIIHQWKGFFECANGIKIFIYNKENSDKFNHLDNKVVITSNTDYPLILKQYPSMIWNRIIIDEADTIKMPKDTVLNAKFIWLITATPNGLVYANKSYINMLFGKQKTWIIDFITVKNTQEYIDKSIKLPKPNKIMINCLTPIEINVIQEVIPKNVLNMINAGNLNDAIKTLNCNTDTQENIFQVITKNINIAIKNKKIELDAENKKTYHGSQKEEHDKKIKNLERLIKRLDERYNSIKEKIYDLNNQYCPICMGDFVKPVVVDCCSNIFCLECLTLGLCKNPKCPFCRKDIFKKNMHLINDSDDESESGSGSEEKSNKKNIKRDKMDHLIEIISNNKNGKFLVFANYYETFKKIGATMDEKLISHETIGGMNKQIIKQIDNFKSGKTKVMMMNATNYGAGLNLEMATDVIIYHRFTKELEEQVIGRAQRIGRTSPLNVYYLIHDNENKTVNKMFDFNDINYNEYLENE